ncbi:MAG: Xaa-Pro peptidase family protein [Chloroflexi bacterium]|nr:Xaa-Pro peptidase family protein [Chloroflexota bacterium]
MNTLNEELTKARAELHALCDVALLSSIHHVTYVSGFEVPHAVGVSAVTVYAGAFAALSVRDEAAWLGVSAGNAAQAQRESRLDGILTFDSFDSFKATDPRGTYLAAMRGALMHAGLGNAGTLGVEPNALPHGAVETIAEHFPNIKLVDVTSALERARLVKTAREIALLRRAAQVGDVGHMTLAELVKEPGRNEFEMWAELIARMNQAVGHEITVSGELVTGSRTTTVNYPGGPQDRVTERGDAVLMDISQRVDGYWSDVTNTHVVGMEPTAHQKKFARTSQDAFDSACENLRSGKRASEAWAAANDTYVKHGMAMPHYMGHQVGVIVNELPRVVPYDHTPIQAGMVFSLEPGAYEGPGGTFGARSEKMVLVTESGPEVLSKFDWGIE